MASLQTWAAQLVAAGKGILAADESTSTCGTRLAQIKVANTEEHRRQWRDVLLTTPGLNQYVSGVILYDETIRQAALNGQPFAEVLQAAGIMPGIKVDKGITPLAGSPAEFITEGLDGLAGRLKEYRQRGAQFAKWRAVLTIAEDTPSVLAVRQNAEALARYAAICQAEGIVPMVEPEVLMDGRHDLDTCHSVTEFVLHEVFNALYQHEVDFSAMILKPNMVTAGQQAVAATPTEVAAATYACLQYTVPAAVPGVAFLSGGQPDALATQHLDLMNKLAGGQAPWRLTYSFGRALQQAPLLAWGGETAQRGAAQAALLARCAACSAAALGQYEDGQAA